MRTSLLAPAVASLAVGLAMPAAAQDPAHAISLFEFGGASGYSPGAGVITDRHGTIFGTTSIGGNGPCLGGAGCGTVFALLPPSAHGAPWAYNVLYNFQGGQDGGSPSAPLTTDDAGALYGYATDGTWGTVFRLLPPEHDGGAWTFQILYVFTNQADGNLEAEYSPLILQRGALYGIASGGASKACGQFGCGSVFRLKPGSRAGAWTEETLYNFTGGTDSGQPTWIAGFDSRGALYVSTALGNGAVVKIAPPCDGNGWTETVISRFKGGGKLSDPSNLILAPDGTLYGIAGKTRGGIAFQLTPFKDGSSKWVRTTIADIEDHGWGPGSLAAGAGGALIGTVEGDFDFFAGNVFKLTPPEDGGAWTYTRLWNFNIGPDRNPLNVVTGRGGNLFGVLQGGDSSNGSLFEFALH